MPLHPTVLVFDFDGVLADTEPLHWRSWAELLARHGESLLWEEYCLVGRGFRDEEMIENLDRLDSGVRRALHCAIGERQEMVRRWCQTQSPISPASAQMITSLTGCLLGLVTSSDREDVEPLLKAAGIHECFAGCVYGGEARRAKPDPEPYRLIGKKLGVDTGFALEDSDAGIRSATAAGFKAIRVQEPADLPSIVTTLLETSRTDGRFSRCAGQRADD
jgi:HAD superfamily hydrolase (TIGR01509 family)